MHKHDEAAKKLFGKPYEQLDESAQKVTHHVAARTHIARDTGKDYDEKASRGQRAADAVAAFGGSWAFIGLFGAIMFTWVLLNSFILLHYDKAFDPYPYILLNLVLSMLAAIQAPVILMSQNRQAEKDRLNAKHDYEVNLKAELEIMLLHEKLDVLREGQWNTLLELQKEQLALLIRLTESRKLK
ncbi:DUF1003 domain-containing protein [Herminiimonas fonticola]|uniref:Putative membrane protein n=1 Tax=Herminiimonas fonticola TaxID=303380 RepID=A0A4R6GFL0_9BURK|nr:DUF1003 domain-containing protein [Herminiimonas fonticola]RBA24505.1 putative membrane protein [Herminiimonas fonticola]TDN93622.1 putative membrane protein [Herminiimonas fonticola]